MARRRGRSNSWTVVRLPKRELSESIVHLAAPLLERLGAESAPDEVQRAFELAIGLWNAQVEASPLWGRPKPKPLAAVRRTMCGKETPRWLDGAFELLSARWRAEFELDPRLVGAWSLDDDGAGRRKLVCETRLPEGVCAESTPPEESRIALGGQYLDEVQIRHTDTSYLRFPVEHHRGELGSDGSVVIHSRMATVLQLFAEGHLEAVGRSPVEVVVGGRRLGPMVLAEVSCSGLDGGVTLHFRGDGGRAPQGGTRLGAETKTPAAGGEP